jgi:hypothetical protein
MHRTQRKGLGFMLEPADAASVVLIVGAKPLALGSIFAIIFPCL